MRNRSTSVKSDGTNVLFDVWLVSRSVTGRLDAALAGAGITADEFGVYSVLTSATGLTPSELARWMSAPPTTVSSFVKRLESRGHVERRRHPDDGRSYVLHLTPAGRRTHARATKAFLPELVRVVEALGSAEPTVRRSLAALHAAVRGEPAGGDLSDQSS